MISANDCRDLRICEVYITPDIQVSCPTTAVAVFNPSLGYSVSKLTKILDHQTRNCTSIVVKTLNYLKNKKTSRGDKPMYMLQFQKQTQSCFWTCQCVFIFFQSAGGITLCKQLSSNFIISVQKIKSSIVTLFIFPTEIRSSKNNSSESRCQKCKKSPSA